MIDATLSLSAAEGLGGADLAAYLKSQGWDVRPSKVPGISIFSRSVSGSESAAEIILPTEKGFKDEDRRVADALRTLAQIEGQSEDDLSNEIRLARLADAPSRLKLKAKRASERDRSMHVSKRNLNDIESVAWQFREALGLFDQEAFNLVDVLENDFTRLVPNFRVKVLKKEEVGASEIYSQITPSPLICMREDIYFRARHNEPWSRYAIAHELGHLLLHYHGYAARFLPEKHEDAESHARIQESEAEIFALAFLMPRALVSSFRDAQSLSQHFRVSVKVAENRIRILENEREGGSLWSLLKRLNPSNLIK